VVCLAPRALKDSVRPRRLSGVVVRPLNFTVRGRVLAQLVYETTDADFADRAIQALRDAKIPCHRTGRGYHSQSLHPGKGSTEDQVCIYIERDTDCAEANRILIGLGAVVERSPPLWLIAGIVLVAAIVAIWAAVAWNS